MGLFRRDPWRNPPDQEVEVRDGVLERRWPRRSAQDLERQAAPSEFLCTPRCTGRSPLRAAVSEGSVGRPGHCRLLLKFVDGLATLFELVGLDTPELPTRLAPTSRWRLHLRAVSRDSPGSSDRELTSSTARGRSRNRGCLGHRSAWPAMRRHAGRATVLVARPSMPRVKCIGVDAG